MLHSGFAKSLMAHIQDSDVSGDRANRDTPDSNSQVYVEHRQHPHQSLELLGPFERKFEQQAEPVRDNISPSQRLKHDNLASTKLLIYVGRCGAVGGSYVWKNVIKTMNGAINEDTCPQQHSLESDETLLVFKTVSRHAACLAADAIQTELCFPPNAARGMEQQSDFDIRTNDISCSE